MGKMDAVSLMPKFQKLQNFQVDVLKSHCLKGDTGPFYTLVFKSSGIESTFKRQTVTAYLVTGHDREKIIKLVVCRPYSLGKESKRHWRVSEYQTGVGVGHQRGNTREEAIRNASAYLGATSDSKIQKVITAEIESRKQHNVPLNPESELTGKGDPAE